MKVKKWKALKEELFTPEEIGQAYIEVLDELLEVDLKGLRKLRGGLTQTELAEMTRISQSELSQIESRSDHKISTLRRIIEALGGSLQIVAQFGDVSVRIGPSKRDKEGQEIPVGRMKVAKA